MKSVGYRGRRRLVQNEVCFLKICKKEWEGWGDHHCSPPSGRHGALRCLHQHQPPSWKNSLGILQAA